MLKKSLFKPVEIEVEGKVYPCCKPLTLDNVNRFDKFLSDAFKEPKEAIEAIKYFFGVPHDIAYRQDLRYIQQINKYLYNSIITPETVEANGDSKKKEE